VQNYKFFRYLQHSFQKTFRTLFFFKSLSQIRLENSLVKAGAKVNILSLLATPFSKKLLELSFFKSLSQIHLTNSPVKAGAKVNILSLLATLSQKKLNSMFYYFLKNKNKLEL